MGRRYINKERNITTSISRFDSETHCEVMVQISGCDPTIPFEDQLDATIGEVKRVQQSEGGVTIFRRVFLSDAANQTERLEERLEELERCATSIIEQPPLCGSKIAVWLYLQSDIEVEALESGLYATKIGTTTHLWGGNLTTNSGDSKAQIERLFERYIDSLEGEGCTLLDNSIRTWLFVQNVDCNYSGVVEGRNEIFEREGLTTETHFISSTGIQGRSADHRSLVMMDHYSIEGLEREQIEILYAPTHLNPTYEYGVSFERGVAIHYADRSHAFISGTASIDNRGEVVHVGDIRNQTLRMWENVEALLDEARFTTKDIAHAIIYLRDISDYCIVRKIVKELLGERPYIIVHAPVCRPKWLIEMECIAIRRA